MGRYTFSGPKTWVVERPGEVGPYRHECRLPNVSARYPRDEDPGKRAVVRCGECGRRWYACPNPTSEIGWTWSRLRLWHLGWWAIQLRPRVTHEPRSTEGPGA